MQPQRLKMERSIMKSRLLSAIVLAAVAVSPIAVSAQPGRDGRRLESHHRAGCYPGERARDCRERLRAERRSHRRYVYRDGRYEAQDSANAAIVGGILGFILGAAVAGSERDRDYYYAHRNDRGWRARCRAAHRGFDYRTGTYLGRDGYRYYCTR